MSSGPGPTVTFFEYSTTPSVMFSPKWMNRKGNASPTRSENTPHSSTTASTSTEVGARGATLASYGTIANWEVVHLVVPPGPLGISLDPKNRNMAVLDKYGPVGQDGSKGVIERSGKVPAGSVLVGVNEHDFFASKSSCREIGDVLKEMTNKERQMRWRVPPTKHVGQAPGPETIPERVEPPIPPPSEVKQTDRAPLLDDKRTSSFAESSAAEPPNASAEMSPQSAKSWVVKGLRSPSFISSRASSSNDLQANPSVGNARPSQLVVMAPPGPLGLNLDGQEQQCAKVIGFKPMNDGSRGALEQHGGIVPGSVIIGINDEDVSKLTRMDVCTRLGLLKDEQRKLTFLLPKETSKPEPSAGVHQPRTSSARDLNFVENLDKRRKIELQLVMKYDKTKLERGECWIVVDADWMNRWVKFVAHQGAEPGQISNEKLLRDSWHEQPEDDESGPRNLVRPDLKVGVHYRCVSPMVWCLLSTLHGADKAPLLARYTVDIDAMAVPNGDLDKAMREPKLKAAALAQTIQEKCKVRVQ